MPEPRERHPRRSPHARPTLGEALARISESLEDEGALGVLVVDASPLAGVERAFGGDAQRAVLEGLANLVQELIGDQLRVSDGVLHGETGRHEVVALIFRHPAETDFFARELPGLARALADGIAQRGHGVGYPYVRGVPRLAIGTAAALRNPTIRPEGQIRAALEEARRDGELESAIEARRRRRQLFDLVLRGQVYSVYEPIVDVATRTVFGYEALARGPQGSELHSPAALFSSATEEDLLFQLDCLCRRSALDGARDYPENVKLFVNVRPTTIHDPSFQADALGETLAKCQLRPSDVVFEISEQESIQNFEIFREVRDYYGKLGFQIALDDVGAGYASLESVMELAPEYIKVDRAFVHGIDEDPLRQELLRALRSVSERIGARMIGEGLDTLEELETLGRLDIPFGQGWLFGKPHPLRADTEA